MKMLNDNFITKVANETPVMKYKDLNSYVKAGYRAHLVKQQHDHANQLIKFVVSVYYNIMCFWLHQEVYKPSVSAILVMNFSFPPLRSLN